MEVTFPWETVAIHLNLLYVVTLAKLASLLRRSVTALLVELLLGLLGLPQMLVIMHDYAFLSMYVCYLYCHRIGSWCYLYTSMQLPVLVYTSSYTTIQQCVQLNSSVWCRQKQTAVLRISLSILASAFNGLKYTRLSMSAPERILLS